MKIYDYFVLSNRNEWLKKRKSTIGGSDASCILGMNPWKTNIDLWAEKIGIAKKQIENNDAIRFGNNAEPLIRQLFGFEHPELKMHYEENNIYVSKIYTFAHASLDGWFTDDNGDTGILEIKTCSPKNSSSWSEWDGKIPDRYYCQLLHYFAVTGFSYAILKAYLRHFDGTATIREYRINKEDAADDISYLMQEEEKFMECIKQGRKPFAKLNI